MSNGEMVRLERLVRDRDHEGIIEEAKFYSVGF